MRFGVGIGSTLNLSLEESFSIVRLAADLGFETVWTNNRTVLDPFHLCARWADETARHSKPVRTGVAVVPAPQSWNPASLASQAATVSVLSGGRFVLGLGTGGYGENFWRSIGFPNRPIAIMREYIEALRSALKGEWTNYRGDIVHLADFQLEVVPPTVPIYLAALGPQMIRLAGGYADGVIINWASPEAIAQSEAWLSEGAAKTGRDRSEVSLSMNIRCSIDDDVSLAQRAVAREILAKITPQPGRRDAGGLIGYRGQFIRLGFEKELVKLESQLAANRSIDELSHEVSEEFCAAAGFFGRAEEAPRRIMELSRGLDEVTLRIATSVAGVEAVANAMRALAPARILAAAKPLSAT